MNSEKAEEAANAIRGFIDQKMDWKDIEQLIKVEQSRKNPIALMIVLPLDLSKNKIKLNLPDQDFFEEDDSESESSESDSESESDEDEEDSNKKNKSVKRPNTVKVDFDLSLSAWANSRKYFDVKRTAAAKKEKTIKSANIALKSAEKKIQRDIAANKAEDSQIYGLRNIREPFLFEKFYWFVSTEGYLVLAGRDNMQNQMLFRRYFQPKDILVTADIEGASIVIIKNKPGSKDEIPPSTISQAGAFAAATSQKAWDNKMDSRTWYGRFEDIDKITKDGKLVPIDNIEVRGGRNHILYQSIDMGLGFIWLLDNEDEAIFVEKKATEVEKEEVKADSDNDSDSDDDLFGDNDVKLSEIIATNASNINVDNEKSESKSEPEVFKEPSKPVEKESKQSLIIDESVINVEKVDDEIKQDEKGDDHENDSDGKKETAKASKSKSSKNSRKKSPGFDNSDEEDPDSIVLDIEKRLQMLSASNKKKTGNSGQQPPKVKNKKNKKGSNTNSEEPSRTGTPKPADGAKAKKLSKKEKEQEARERHRLAEINRKERQKKADEAELQKLLVAANNTTNNSGDDQNSEELKGLEFPAHRLSFRLQPGQKPVAAVPVFGPWDSISKQIKFRIKLSPGTTKKGKAVKDIVHALGNIQKLDTTQTDPDYAWPIEVNLIKALKPSEILLPIAVSKMTVYIPNVTGNTGGSISGGRGGKSAGGRGGR